MVKGFRQIASLTMLSRIFGMVRDMSFAHFLGAGGMMDAWIIAFQIPNLSRRLFGEGAASSSFIPVYREQLEKDPASARGLANTVVTVVFCLLTAVVVLGAAGIILYKIFVPSNEQTQRMLSLICLMLPYMIMICTTAMLAGILQVHRHFAAPAAAPIILNIFIIATLLVTSKLLGFSKTQTVFAIATAVLAAGVTQMMMQIVPLEKMGVGIKPAWQVNSEPFKRIALLMGPMIIGLTATQLNTLADNWIAKILSGSVDKGEFFIFLGNRIRYPLWDGTVSHLYYSQRLYQFPLGVLGISLATAIFPVMSSEAARKDLSSLASTVGRGIRGAVFTSIPAIAGLMLVATPLVRAVFQRGEFTASDTRATSWLLIFYAVGLCGYFTQQILARAFYSMQDPKGPMRSAVKAVGLNIALNLTLVWFIGAAGLALSTAICSYFQVIILLRGIEKKLGKAVLDGLLSTLWKSGAAALFMGLVGCLVLYFWRNMPKTTLFDCLRLALVVPIAGSVYFLLAKLLRIEALSLITGKKIPAK
jgi:putative peptidoglycan lipid II flippase